jgi:hypothetical protein
MKEEEKRSVNVENNSGTGAKNCKLLEIGG